MVVEFYAGWHCNNILGVVRVCIMGASHNPITNWPQYNKSLINRGSLTFWVDAEAMSNWFHHDHHGRRGRSVVV